MDSYRLDRQITFRRAVQTRDDFGGVVETWEDFATVWASKRDVKASEHFKAAQVIAVGTTVFHVRWRNDITPDMRLVFEDQEYDIMPPMELGRRDGLEIMAVARIA